MSNEGEWKTAGRRNRHQSEKSGFNRFHTQKRVSILEQVHNGSLEPDKAEQMLRPSRYRPISRTVYCRTTKSGAVAVYGFSTRPIVLYEDRWYKFLEWLQTGELGSYLKDNSDTLRKPRFFTNSGAEVEENTSEKDVTKDDDSDDSNDSDSDDSDTGDVGDTRDADDTRDTDSRVIEDVENYENDVCSA